MGRIRSELTSVSQEQVTESGTVQAGVREPGNAPLFTQTRKDGLVPGLPRDDAKNDVTVSVTPRSRLLPHVPAQPDAADHPDAVVPVKDAQRHEERPLSRATLFVMNAAAPIAPGGDVFAAGERDQKSQPGQEGHAPAGQPRPEADPSAGNGGSRGDPPGENRQDAADDNEGRRREVAQQIQAAWRERPQDSEAATGTAQIETTLRGVAENLPPGTPFPTHRELREALETSHDAIRRAVYRLHNAGILTKVTNVGSHISTVEEKAAALERAEERRLAAQERKEAERTRIEERARLDQEALEALEITFIDDERLQALAQQLVSGTPDYPSLVQTFLERQTPKQRATGIDPLSFPGDVFELYCDEKLAEIVAADSSLSFPDIPHGHTTDTFEFHRSGGVVPTIQASKIGQGRKGGSEFDGLVMLDRSEQGLPPIPVLIEYKMSGSEETTDAPGSEEQYPGYVSQLIEDLEIKRRFAPIVELFGTTEVGYIIITNPEKIRPESELQAAFAQRHGILEPTAFSYTAYITQLNEALAAVASQSATGEPQSGKDHEQTSASRGQETERTAPAGGQDGGGLPPEGRPTEQADDDEGRNVGKQKIRTIFEDQPLDYTEEEHILERQIADRLQTAIRDLQPGISITNATELAEIAGVNEPIAQLALTRMSDAELIFALSDRDPYVVRPELPSEDIPLATHIEEALRVGIVLGPLGPRYKIPTEVQLKDMGLSAVEIRNLMTSLQEDGLVVSRPRIGTRVTEGPHPLAALTPREIQEVEQPIITRRIPPDERIANLNEKRINIAQTIRETHAANALNREDPETLAEQVTTIMQGIISNIPLGNPIPNESELAGLFGLNEQAAREAMTMLHKTNLVYTLPGVGTYTVRRESDPDIPLQEHLERAFRVSIAARVLPPGYKLPTSTQLGEMGLKPTEVRQLQASLRVDELVVLRRTVGTRVTEHQLPYVGQIKKHLESLILSTELIPGLRIPSASDFAHLFDASVGDIDFALQKLQTDGIVRSIEGGALVLTTKAERAEIIARDLLSDLEPGQALPSQRKLAKRLGIGSTSVQEAYEKLRDEGLIDTQNRVVTRAGGEYETEAQRVEAAILTRMENMQPGERMPSQRTLAAEIGTSRDYVRSVYERFRDQGLLDVTPTNETRVGGTYVTINEQLDEAILERLTNRTRGERFLSQRQFAEELGIRKVQAELAYERAIAKGLLHTYRGMTYATGAHISSEQTPEAAEETPIQRLGELAQIFTSTDAEGRITTESGRVLVWSKSEKRISIEDADNPDYFFKAYVTEGIDEMRMFAVGVNTMNTTRPEKAVEGSRHPDIKPKALIKAAFDYLDSREPTNPIKKFAAIWYPTQNGGPSLNYDMYNATLTRLAEVNDGQVTPQMKREAAKSTWTYSVIKELGFTEVAEGPRPIEDLINFIFVRPDEHTPETAEDPFQLGELARVFEPDATRGYITTQSGRILRYEKVADEVIVEDCWNPDYRLSAAVYTNEDGKRELGLSVNTRNTTDPQEAIEGERHPDLRAGAFVRAVIAYFDSLEPDNPIYALNDTWPVTESGGPSTNYVAYKAAVNAKAADNEGLVTMEMRQQAAEETWEYGVVSRLGFTQITEIEEKSRGVKVKIARLDE